MAKTTCEGDVYIHNLALFIRSHEQQLANALVAYRRQTGRKSAAANKDDSLDEALAKPVRLSLSLHHLYYILGRLAEHGVDVGPLDIRLDSIDDTNNYVSFLTEFSHSKRMQGAADTQSIHSMSSVKSVMSSVSALWSTFSTAGHAAGSALAKAETVSIELTYLNSAFTKLPCLRLANEPNAKLIEGHEEYPFETATPVKVFKNIAILEVSDLDPKEIFGWDYLSERLRNLTIKKSSFVDPYDVLVELVKSDMATNTTLKNKTSNSPNANSKLPSTVANNNSNLAGSHHFAALDTNNKHPSAYNSHSSSSAQLDEHPSQQQHIKKSPSMHHYSLHSNNINNSNTNNNIVGNNYNSNPITTANNHTLNNPSYYNQYHHYQYTQQYHHHHPHNYHHSHHLSHGSTVNGYFGYRSGKNEFSSSPSTNTINSINNNGSTGGGGAGEIFTRRYKYQHIPTVSSSSTLTSTTTNTSQTSATTSPPSINKPNRRSRGNSYGNDDHPYTHYHLLNGPTGGSDTGALSGSYSMANLNGVLSQSLGNNNNNNNNVNTNTNTNSSANINLNTNVSGANTGNERVVSDSQSPVDDNLPLAASWLLLKKLSMIDCKIERIGELTFDSMKNLKSLDMSHNLLLDIPIAALNKLTNLKRLDLSFNQITNVKGIDLFKLTDLILKNNSIIEIDDLSKLPNLSILDLRNNSITDVKNLKSVFTIHKDKVLIKNLLIMGNPIGNNRGNRINIFDYFNGVQFDNHVKIDSSRPGMIESRMLLDERGAQMKFKNFIDESIISKMAQSVSHMNLSNYINKGGARGSTPTTNTTKLSFTPLKEVAEPTTESPSTIKQQQLQQQRAGSVTPVIMDNVSTSSPVSTSTLRQHQIPPNIMIPPLGPSMEDSRVMISRRTSQETNHTINSAANGSGGLGTPFIRSLVPSAALPVITPATTTVGGGLEIQRMKGSSLASTKSARSVHSLLKEGNSNRVEEAEEEGGALLDNSVTSGLKIRVT